MMTLTCFSLDYLIDNFMCVCVIQFIIISASVNTNIVKFILTLAKMVFIGRFTLQNLPLDGK